MDDNQLRDITPVSLKGVGEKSAKLYEKLEILNLEDLLYYYPKTYIQYARPVSIESITEGMTVSILAKTENNFFQKKFGIHQISTVTASDSTGSIHLTFFNLNYLRKLLSPGSIHVFHGIVKKKGNSYCLEQPEIIKPEEYDKRCLSLQPVYPLCKGLSSNAIKKAVLQTIAQYGTPNENLSSDVLAKYHLMDRKEAIYLIHFPTDYDTLLAAHKRLVFEEFYLFLSEIKKRKEAIMQEKSNFCMIETAQVKRFQEQLPYKLTPAQNKTLNEIKEDLTGGYVLNRLVQGDVGSGKTIIAFISMLLCATNGYQSAMMAPTEVLAQQHYESLSHMVETYRLEMQPLLLTGSMSAKEKREAYEKIESGQVNAVIGTHALFQDKVDFQRLALVITDEQHRFGVKQRDTLEKKSVKPHVLVMSATPIPRTLATVLYGDLQVSVIDELPSNRIPIKNCVVDTEYRNKAYQFIQTQVKNGYQAYIVCPMVEDNEMQDVESVKSYAKMLKEYYQNRLNIGILHGQMKPEEKVKIMNEFACKNIDILVATTVIEVGINVVNATVMMVENAERFGLSQLHQLRGRVGRGSAQSYCIFMTHNKNPETMERLQILNKSNDGFYIANEDLRLRGPGDLFGIRQSGVMNFRIADIYQDGDLLLLAKEAIDNE